MNLAERHASELWKQNAPDHQPQRIRRHSLPNKSKVVKYCFIALLLLLAIAVYKQRDAFTGPSGMAPATSDQAGSVSEKPITSILSGSYAQEEEISEQTRPTLLDQTNQTTPFYPRFGKCTASFGDPDPPYEAAIASHELHNQIHGYPHYILREHMIRGLWSKHGWIITVLGQELSKPEDQRLQWLLWHDRDTVLMNPQIPLDIFVPPEESFAHINLLVTKDRNGLNNGVFMVRVSQWAMKMFASALSIREYQPDVVLKYTEQSGMEETIERPWWNGSVAYVPQRWFNGFPPNADMKDDRNPSHSRPGSLLIHFASNRDGLRPQRMSQWGNMASNRVQEWDKPAEETRYLEEIAEYWERVGRNESFDSINRDIGRRDWTLRKSVTKVRETQGRG